MRDARNDDSRPEDDQEAIDRAFAELIADFHQPTRRAADPDDGSRADSTPPGDEGPDHGGFGRYDSDDLPGPRPARPAEFRFDLDASDTTEPDDPPEERYVPPPAPPLSRPTAPVFVGWLGIGYAIVAMFLLAFGVPLPQWAGWIAIASFLGGLALLFSRLPRHRPPDDDDGARL